MHRQISEKFPYSRNIPFNVLFTRGELAEPLLLVKLPRFSAWKRLNFDGVLSWTFQRSAQPRP